MIPGISDRRQLPRIGKIRLGEKRKSASGAEYPAALDYFNFREVPEVEKIYGKPCRELDIIIPVEDSEMFFHQGLKAYGKTRLFCSSNDGITAKRLRIGAATEDSRHHKKGQVLDPGGEAYIAEKGLVVPDGGQFELPCPAQECSFYKSKQCRGIGLFLFMLPRVPKFGVYQISTTSFHSMVFLNSYIDAIKTRAGRIAWIPLKLRLVPKNVAPDGKKKIVHVLELIFEGTPDDLLAYGKSNLLPAPLPPTAMPERAVLEQEVQDDLMPHGGEAVEGQVIEDGPAFGEEAPPPEEPADTPAEAARKEVARPAPAPQPAKAEPKPAAAKRKPAGSF